MGITLYLFATLMVKANTFETHTNDKVVVQKKTNGLTINFTLTPK